MIGSELLAIDKFREDYGIAHYYLLMHAAFPLALTPDLLYHIRFAFQHDVKNRRFEVPWYAPADILLSPFVSSVQAEMVEMDIEIQKELRQRLRRHPRFGEKRVHEIARFLDLYTERFGSGRPSLTPFINAQGWAARIYTRPEIAIEQLAREFLRSVKQGTPSDQIGFDRLITALAENLSEHSDFLALVRSNAHMLLGNEEEAQNYWKAAFANGDVIVGQVVIGKDSLPKPQSTTSSAETSSGNIDGAKDQITEDVAPSPSLGERIRNVFSNFLRETPNDREQMIDAVYHNWIEGFLHSIEGPADYISRELELLPIETKTDSYATDANNIVEIYKNFDGLVLILGEPGSGKTVLLLKLAEHLIAEARADEQKPLPIVFNLSSWAAIRTPLQEWVVESLNHEYGLSKRTGRHWVETENLILLLDGFDEIPSNYRNECINAINAFREAYRTIDIVVCSRAVEYQSLTTQLNLNGAIRIGPITQEQIATYLRDSLSPRVAETIFRDPMLLEMAQSPFLLNMIKIVYQNTSETSFKDLQTWSEKRAALVESYVRNQLKSNKISLDNAQTIEVLSNIAKEAISTSRILLSRQDFRKHMRFYNNTNQFIDELVACRIMRRIGQENFSFLHQMLLEYFASLGDTSNLIKEIQILVLSTENSPIAGATVTIFPLFSQIVTSNDGRAIFSYVSQGQQGDPITVTVRKDGMITQTTEIDIKPERLGNLIQITLTPAMGDEATSASNLLESDEGSSISPLAVFSELDKDVVDTFVRSAVQLLSAKGGGIYLYDPDSKILTLVSGYNLPLELGRQIRVGEGLAGKLISDRLRYLSVENYANSPYRIQEFVSHQNPAVLSVAMYWKGEIVGIIYVDDLLGRLFTNDDAANLITLSDLFLSGITDDNNASKFSRNIEQFISLLASADAKSSVSETTQHIAINVAELMAADIVSIYIYDSQTQRILSRPTIAGNLYYPAAVTRTPFVQENSIVYKVIESDEIRVASRIDEDRLFYNSRFVKEENVKSVITAPLQKGGSKFGAIFISYRREHHVSENEIYQLRIVVSYTSGVLKKALDNSQSDMQLKLNQIEKLLQKNPSDDDVTLEVAKSACQLTDGTLAHVTLIQQRSNSLKLVASYAKDTTNALQDKISSIDLTQLSMAGIKGRVISEAKSWIVNDVDSNPEYIQTDPSTRSEIAVPIMDSTNKVIGIINVLSDKTYNFDDSHVQILDALARLASVALKRTKSIDLLIEIEKLIDQRSHDEVLKKILPLIQEIVPYDRGSIQRIIGDRREIVATYGFANKDINPNFLRPISEDALISQIIDKQQPVVFHQLSSTQPPFWEINADTREIKSWIGIPVFSRSAQAIGFITLDTMEENIFSNIDQSILQKIGEVTSRTLTTVEDKLQDAEDNTLFNALRNKDSGAWEQLFNEYNPRLRQSLTLHAYRHDSSIEIDDVLQDVWLRFRTLLEKQVIEYTDEQSLLNYLRVLGFNIMREYIRREMLEDKRYEDLPDDIEIMDISTTETPESVQREFDRQNDLVELISKIRDELNDSQIAILDQIVQGVKLQQIAANSSKSKSVIYQDWRTIKRIAMTVSNRNDFRVLFED